MKTTLENAAEQPATVDLSYAVLDKDQTVQRFEKKGITIPARGRQEVEVTHPWADAKLWSPSAPNLYGLKTTVSSGGKAAAGVTERFGFLEFAIDGIWITLNGERLHMLGCPAGAWKRNKPRINGEHNWLHTDTVLYDGYTILGEAAMKPTIKRNTLVARGDPYIPDVYSVFYVQRESNLLDLRAGDWAGHVMLNDPFWSNDNVRPVLARFYDYQTRVWAGEAASQLIFIVNDSGREQTFDLRITADGQAKELWSQKITLAHSARQFVPIKLPAFNAEKLTQVNVTLTASAGGKVLSTEQRTISVFPKSWIGEARNQKVAVYDPNNSTQGLFEAIGVTPVRIQNPAMATDAKLLVIGENVSAKELGTHAPVLHQFVENGGNILVLRQTDLSWFPVPVEVQKGALGAGGNGYSGRLTQVLAIGHPVFDGLLPEDFTKWGDMGLVRVGAMKPVLGGNVRNLTGLPPDEVTLLELAHGKGRYLLTTLELTPENVQVVPPAAKLLANILKYAATPEAPRGKTLVLHGGGGERAKQLHETLKLSADYVSAEPASLEGYNLVVLNGYESIEAGEVSSQVFVYSGKGQPIYLRDLVIQEVGGNPVFAWKTDEMKPFTITYKGFESSDKSGEFPTYFTGNCWDGKSSARIDLADAPDSKKAIRIENLEGNAIQFYNFQGLPIRAGKKYEVSFSYMTQGSGVYNLGGKGHAGAKVDLAATGDQWKEVKLPVSISGGPVPSEGFAKTLRSYVQNGGTLLVQMASPSLQQWLETTLGVKIASEQVFSRRSVKIAHDPLLAGVSDGDMMFHCLDPRFDSYIKDTPGEHDFVSSVAVPQGAKVLTYPATLNVTSIGKGRLIIDQSRWTEVSGKTSLYWGYDSRKIGQRLQASLLNNLGADLKLPPRAQSQAAVIGLAFEPLNIAKFANRGLVDDKAGDGKGWLDIGDPWNLRLPAGRLIASEVPFQILDENANNGFAAIALRGKEKLTDLPGKVNDIPVNKQAKAIFFLHTSGYAGSKDGDPVMEYEVRYEGFSKIIPGQEPGGLLVRIPVRAGMDIGDWLGVPSAVPAWKTKDPKNEGQVNLYMARWDNPRPELLIESIAVRSLEKSEVPFVLGVTLGHEARNLINGNTSTMQSFVRQMKNFKFIKEEGSAPAGLSFNAWDSSSVGEFSLVKDPVTQMNSFMLRNLEGRESSQVYIDRQWNKIPVKAGKKYKLAIFYMTAKGGFGSLNWEVVAGEKKVAGEELPQVVSDGRWTAYVTTFTPKEDGLFGMLINANGCAGPEQAFYFRDLWLTQED